MEIKKTFNGFKPWTKTLTIVLMSLGTLGATAFGAIKYDRTNVSQEQFLLHVQSFDKYAKMRQKQISNDKRDDRITYLMDKLRALDYKHNKNIITDWEALDRTAYIRELRQLGGQR